MLSINENAYIEKQADIIIKLKQDGTLGTIDYANSPQSGTNGSFYSSNSLFSSYDLVNTLDDSTEIVSK